MINTKKLSLIILSAAIILPAAILFYAQPVSASLFTTIDITAPGNPSGVVYGNMYVGQTQQLKAIDHDSGADITSKVNWYTINPSGTTNTGVSVTPLGLVTARGPGATTVYTDCITCYRTTINLNITVAPAGTTPTPTPNAINMPETTPKETVSTTPPTQASSQASTSTATIVNPLGAIDSFPKLLDQIISTVGTLIASLATIMLIYAGILYLTSAGNPERMKKAQTALIYAIVGIVIGVSASALAGIIKNIIGVNS